MPPKKKQKKGQGKTHAKKEEGTGSPTTPSAPVVATSPASASSKQSPPSSHHSPSVLKTVQEKVKEDDPKDKGKERVEERVEEAAPEEVKTENKQELATVKQELFTKPKKPKLEVCVVVDRIQFWVANSHQNQKIDFFW